MVNLAQFFNLFQKFQSLFPKVTHGLDIEVYEEKRKQEERKI